MTQANNTISNILANIANLNLEIETVDLTDLTASELSTLYKDVSDIIHQFMSFRNRVDEELQTKIVKDDVDDQFDNLVACSHENVTKLTSRSRRAMEELGFETKRSLPSFIAASAGWESINTFCNFICKCEDALKKNTLENYDTLRLEAMLKIILRAIRKGYLTYFNWISEDAMFETVKSLADKANLFGLTREDKELLDDITSLKHFLNTDPDGLLGI